MLLRSTSDPSSTWLPQNFTQMGEYQHSAPCSTIVQYQLKNGRVVSVYSLAASDDGLKIDPKTGDVWALQNQDGNFN